MIISEIDMNTLSKLMAIGLASNLVMGIFFVLGSHKHLAESKNKHLVGKVRSLGYVIVVATGIGLGLMWLHFH